MTQIEFDISPVFSTKTPFLYPGSKSRLRSRIFSWIPSDIKTLVSPFLGGGAIELYCASKGINVFGSDNFEPLINSWKYLKKDSKTFIDLALDLFPLSYDERYHFYNNQMESNCTNLDGKALNDFERAVYFFLVSRQSFRGMNLSSVPAKDYRVGSANIKLIKKFRTWSNNKLTVKHSDYRETIDSFKDHFMYFDPPYVEKERFYGTKESCNDSFDHEELHNRITKLNNLWILSYFKHDLIMDLYKDYKIVEFDRKVTIAAIDKGENHNTNTELLIMNY